MPDQQKAFVDGAESQYDLSTYTGRVQHMFAILDSGLLLKSDQDVHDAVALLDAFKRGEVDGRERAADLWDALTLKDSAVHPDTGVCVSYIYIYIYIYGLGMLLYIVCTVLIPSIEMMNMHAHTQNVILLCGPPVCSRRRQ